MAGGNSQLRQRAVGSRQYVPRKTSHARAPFFRRHLAADLGDGLIYREAFTTTTADQVIDHLVNQTGVQLANGAERRSALQDLPEPGKTVFVYRPTENQKTEGSRRKAESCEQLAAR